MYPFPSRLYQQYKTGHMKYTATWSHHHLYLNLQHLTRISKTIIFIKISKNLYIV